MYTLFKLRARGMNSRIAVMDNTAPRSQCQRKSDSTTRTGVSLDSYPNVYKKGLVPVAGIEPATVGLQNRCATVAPHWLPIGWQCTTPAAHHHGQLH